MPYSGADDPKLPDHVKKLSPDMRSKWVGTFISAHKNCMDSGKGGGAGSPGTCEGVAMKMANGAVKSLLDEEFTLAEVKCDNDNKHAPPSSSPMPVVEVGEVPPPLGGATSFAEADSYKDSQKIDDNVFNQRYMFEQITRNVWNDDELTLEEKASAVASAAQELANRIAAGPEANKSIGDRVKSLLGWKAEPPKKGEDKVKVISDAIDALQPGGAAGPDKARVVKEITDAIGKLDDEAEKKRLGDRLAKVKALWADETDSALFFTKDSSGAWRWLGVFTNKYRDKQSETFREEAHKEYESWVDDSGQYPELWLWHTPGTRFGQADLVGYNDGFQLASGTIDVGMEDVVEGLVADAKEGKLAMSHGYTYRPSDLSADGVYERYRTREISVLPRGREANGWTMFSLENLKEVLDMSALAPEKRAFLAGKLGEDRMKAVEEHIGVLNKELADSGVSWKDLGDVLGDGGAPPETPTLLQDSPPPADPPKDPADAEEEEEEKDPTAGTAALAEALETAVSKALAPIESRLMGIETKVKSLEASDDEKVAALAGARVAPPTATRPTSSKEIEPEAAKALTGEDPSDIKSNGYQPSGAAEAAALPFVQQFLLGGNRLPQN